MSLISKVQHLTSQSSGRKCGSCRACGKSSLEEVLDMGPMPLAGDFREAGYANVLYPLAIDVCQECGLLQVREVVPHQVIFSPQYSYSSSTIGALVRHFEEYAREVALPAGVRRKRLLEIGCNDGVFLGPLAKVGYEVMGVDACENVTRAAKGKGLSVQLGTFGRRCARDLYSLHGAFDVVTCSNVFAHNSDLQDFLEGLDVLIEKEKGEFWVEVHSARALFEGLQWDCFYHEHCFYWSIHSLSKCLSQYGFHLLRYKTTGMHGGAIRAVFGRGGTPVFPQEAEISPTEWTKFGTRCLHSRDVLQSSVRDLGIRYAYGAAGRAVTLINWAGLAPYLSFVVDGSPLRFGRVIPNTSIPIISEEAFSARNDVGGWCFVSAHNYLPDIRRKVDVMFPGKTTGFVTPLPHVEIR